MFSPRVNFLINEYTNLVNVFKTKGIVLKSYRTIQTKILKGQKSSLPIPVSKTLAVIDQAVSISNSFFKIYDSLDSEFNLNDLDL